MVIPFTNLTIVDFTLYRDAEVEWYEIGLEVGRGDSQEGEIIRITVQTVADSYIMKKTLSDRFGLDDILPNPELVDIGHTGEANDLDAEDVEGHLQLNPPDKIHVTSDMYDNRDESETWLRIPGVGVVVVNPQELHNNMVENCTGEKD